MMKTVFGIRTVIALFALGVSLSMAGCALDDGAAPSLTGPSEFGLSVTATATPNRLPRDGSSQSVVVLSVSDAQSKPMVGQRLTLSISPAAAALSATEVVTDSSGQATFTLTAPPASAIAGNTVTVQATPVGISSGGAVPRTIEITLTGAANTTIPEPSFTVTPPSPEVGQLATFDASNTRDEGTNCRSACLYAWQFGDGSVANGLVVTHAYTAARTYTVTLTVIDSAGASASTISSVIVRSIPAPIVTIAVTPDPPFVDRQAVFAATATAAPGHSIVRYEWNFGDDTTASTTGPNVVKTYDEVGTFVVTVSAIDDTGQAGIGARTVVVGFSAAAPVANFTISPTNPEEGQNVSFNGSSSTVGVGATIVRYVWDFGDGGAALDTGTTPTASHTYANDGTYGVTLTITDSLGRTASKTATVTVEEP
jgi:large repetitive protein